jgi:hypothetical protein
MRSENRNFDLGMNLLIGEIIEEENRRILKILLAGILKCGKCLLEFLV